MIEFYKNIWKGNFDGSDKELEKLLSVSSDIIDNEIFLSGYTIEEIPDIFSDSVKKAINEYFNAIKTKNNSDGE